MRKSDLNHFMGGGLIGRCIGGRVGRRIRRCIGGCRIGGGRCVCGCRICGRCVGRFRNIGSILGILFYRNAEMFFDERDALRLYHNPI